MSFLGSLSSDAREELRAFVDLAVERALEQRERVTAEHEWLDTDEAASLLSTTANAIRCRVRRGWLSGDISRDGKRLFVRRGALLDELDRRASR
jgi:hypothetical protein